MSTDHMVEKKGSSDSRELAKHLLEAASLIPGFIFRYVVQPDGSGMLEFITDGCQRLLGFSPDELMSDASLILNVFQKKDLNRMQIDFANSMHTLQPWEITAKFKKHGSKSPHQMRWLKLSATPRRLPDGSTAFEGVGIDFTHSKEEERDALFLERARQAEDFISTLAHDMKVPLIGTDRILELMLNGSFGELSSEQAAIINKLRQSNNKTIAMVRDLLDVYRFEAGTQPLNFEAIDLVDRLKSVIKEHSAIIEGKGLNLARKLNGPLVITGDLKGIDLLLKNLVDNAVKFAPAETTVEVRLGRSGKNTVLEISNEGEGISPDEQQQLFQRFWQGQAGKKYVAGTGLGLYLCKRIIDAHHGKISCQSSVGSTTTFLVELPTKQNWHNPDQAGSS